LSSYGKKIGKLVFTNPLKICFIFYFQMVSILCFSQDGEWTQKSDIPTSRWHLTAEQIDGKIYAIGGVNGYNAMEEYDPVEDTWTELQSMPTVRAFAGSGVVDGKVYIIGGSKLNQAAVKTVEMYEPGIDTWTSKHEMPEARFGIGSSVVDGKIYIFGGNDPAESLVESYDPATDTWNSDLADMPTARWEPECVELDGKIYVVGGFSSGGAAIIALEMYDPGTDSWTEKEPMPEPRGGGAAIEVDGIIYYLGGSSNFGPPRNDVFAYDPMSDSWAVLDDMPFEWFLMASASVDGLIYLISGSQVPWPHSDNFKGVYSYDPQEIYFSVKDRPANNKITLDDNFPNPFSLNTEISYSIQERSYVRLTIFNLLGEKVAVLVNEVQSRGNYRVEFHRNELENGIYFYSLRTDRSLQTKKMVLVDL
jgi:hypothetical protein